MDVIEDVRLMRLTEQGLARLRRRHPRISSILLQNLNQSLAGLVARQVERLRYQEIGRILDIPVGTVKSRMHAAVRQIRAALEREGIEP